MTIKAIWAAWWYGVAAFLVCALVLVLAGCTSAEQENVQTTNREWNVRRLFTVDGCTAYDAGPFYFVRCERATATTAWTTTRMVGKVPTTNHHRVVADEPE